MKMSLVSVVGGGGEGGVGGCASMSTLIPIVALAGFDGALSLIALYQIIRIHLRNREAGWTRQKVLHLMLGCSNFGYVIFFMFTLVAHCEKWLCWSKMCGFIFMEIAAAYPKILFIAAFLSLLSFWIDLCHQANDEDEDADADNEESSARQVLLDSKVMHASISERRRTCCSFQNIEVRGRQKFVIVVVAVVFVLMLSFAVLIWIGMGKNAIDSLTVAQIYVHLCAVTSLLLGGALGYYGVLLFLKLRKLRSERSFADMWKVGGLAAVSVLCFTSSSLVALLTDIALFYSMRLWEIEGIELPLLLVIYHFIGITVPSAFLLWVMRELPPPIMPPRGEQRVITFITYDPSIMLPSGQQAAGNSSEIRS